MGKKDVLQGRSIVRKNVFNEAFTAIENIKKAHPLTDYLQIKGVALEEAGKKGELKGNCPFHDDKEQSLLVDKAKEIFTCSICNLSGNIIDAVSLLEKTGRDEAMQKLETAIDKKQESAKKLLHPLKLVIPEEEKAELAKADPEPIRVTPVPVSLDDLVKHWQGIFAKSKKALKLLETKDITDKTIYTRFALGYSDGSLTEKLGEGQKLFLRQEKLLTPEGKETFTDSYIFPLSGEQGKTVNLLSWNLKEADESRTHYLYQDHRGIFNRKASKVYPDNLIIAGSLPDALSLLQLGFENIQLASGEKKLTEEHTALLQADRVKAVVLAFDPAEELKTKLLKMGISLKVIIPQDGQSWNDALQEGITRSGVDEMIKTSQLFAPEEKDFFTAEKKHGAYLFTMLPVSYTLTGVTESFVNSLKVNVKAVAGDETHYDTLNLYSARSRSGYSLQLSRIAGVEPRRIEKDLIKILEYLEEQRDKKFAGESDEVPELTPEQVAAGMELLQNPAILDQAAEDLTALGYVGEDLNKKLVYLCATSRKMDDPISVLLVSQSASGKSYLIDSVKKLIPPEETESITTLSDQALNYMDNLVHKFVVFGEAVHSEIIEHQLREMLSSKELSRYVVQKDPQTGELATKRISKPVIVSSAMSTTNHKINPENASRYFLVHTDESAEQTKRIHQAQREKYTLNRYQKKRDLLPALIDRHHSAQRLLKSLAIVNPFAHLLDFPASSMRSRRDHDRFIDLISVVCFLRQYQKKQKKEGETAYIECDLTDYKEAYTIMINGILASTMGELPVQAVTLYDLIREMVHEESEIQNLSPTEITFTQREIREYSALSQMFVKRYLRILTDFEYILTSGQAFRGSRKSYYLYKDEALNALNTTMIPTPEEMEKQLKSGSVGQSGSRPTLKGKK